MSIELRHIKYLWLYLVIALTGWLGDILPILRLRGKLSKFGFFRVGKNFQLANGSRFSYSAGIEIGNDVYIANYCWLQGSGGIELGDEVMLGPFTVIATNNHTKRGGSYRFGPPDRGRVVIGRGAWLGAHVTVTGGVSIGDGACVSAGSVVTSDVPAHSIVAGVPARVLSKSAV